MTLLLASVTFLERELYFKLALYMVRICSSISVFMDEEVHDYNNK